MTSVLNFSDLVEGRSPHGERGLKYDRRAIIGHGHVALLMESVD